MRRVLLVSPHFPPVNAPDLHRARLALPHLRASGWDPVVLALAPESIEGATLDPLLEKSCPPDIPVHRIHGISPRVTRRFGVGSLWLRCGRALRRTGDALLAREKFDAVFFTTSQFDAFTLGPRWLARFGVPYVLDFQDPWVSDYYTRSSTRPPGGRIKYWLSQYNARRREPAVVRHAGAIVSVSAAYGPDLLARHPSLNAERIHHLPFGFAASDLEIARAHVPVNPLVPRGDNLVHHVYVGRVTPNMARPLDLLFRAFRRYLDTHPAEAARHRFHFIGTDYAPPSLARLNALPVAERAGVGAYVAEHPTRIPYFEALHYIANADALLILGSDDASYSASKLFPYLAAGRPLLVLARRESQMLALARAHGVEACHGFGEASAAENESILLDVHAGWFAGGACQRACARDASVLLPHSAEHMTSRLASIFDQATVATPLQLKP